MRPFACRQSPGELVAATTVAFDPETSQVVMFGPANVSETWIWDGTTWSLYS